MRTEKERLISTLLGYRNDLGKQSQLMCDMAQDIDYLIDELKSMEKCFSKTEVEYGPSDDCVILDNELDCDVIPERKGADR